MNTEEIIEGYLGDTIVNSIYQGSELIWPIYFGDKYLIGGAFTSCNGIAKNKILRLNDDGTVDDTWYNDNDMSGVFYTLAYDNINKKIYAGGDPSLDGGLVRFNLDGTKDTSFDIGTGFDGIVFAIYIDNTNSKIYVGGNFTTYKGNPQKGLVRLYMNGSRDTRFNIGSGFDGTGSDVVRAVTIDTINSKIYVGGNFTTYQDNTQNRLIRLNMNGTKDTSFNIGSGFRNAVLAICIDNNKLYAGGRFYGYKGRVQNGLIRLNLDGTKDTSFDIGTGFDGISMIYAIKIDNTNSKIYVGGNFKTYQDNTQNKLIRLNMNGTKDTSFDIGTGFNNLVHDILVDNEKNKIYIVGGFGTYNGISANRIARLNMNGSLDNTFNIQLNSSAHAILKYTE